ncbi:Piwi domain-containing protein [Cladochytrium replicatum]|nr:Piwi domain-containing protein [Cladochytrium replicatum]
MLHRLQRRLSSTKDLQALQLPLKQQVTPTDLIHLPRRPNHGTTGRPVVLRTNFFPIHSIPSANIHHYELSIVPEIHHLKTARRLFTLWEELNRNTFLRSVRPVFDGRTNVYSPRPLPLIDGSASFVVDLPEENDDFPNFRNIQELRRPPRQFKIQIQKIGEINMDTLHNFLDGRDPDAPEAALLAMDTILRHLPSMTLNAVGRCFYTPDGAASIAGGAELWQGFHQAIKVSRGGMMLNIDLASTAFFEPGPVIDAVAKILGKRGPEEIRQPMGERDRTRLEKTLKNVKVVCTHRGTNKRRWKVTGITSTPAERTIFPLNGVEENVTSYFRERYGLSLQYPHFPCLIVGDPTKHVYLPMEVCRILQGQRIMKRLNEKQTTDLIRFTCQPPHIRSSKVTNGFNLLQQTDNEYLEDFNIRLGSEMATVPARVLPTPTLSYNPNSREAFITPREGSWNLRDRKVAHGAVMLAWSVVVFGHEKDIPPPTVAKFVREMAVTCRETGIEIRNMNPPVRYGNPQGNIENILKTAYMEAGDSVNAKPQLIVCILPNAGVPLYAEIKRITDTVVGIASQCVQSKHVFQAKKQYCANVALKINVKLGGMNAFLGSHQLPFVAERPTIVFGADVTHPATGDTSKPSLAACVASMDAQCSRYAAAIRAQRGHKEVISDLSGMVAELLRTFYQFCGSKPHRMVFYRDGVSDSQFAVVHREEVTAIRKACESLEPGYRPAITFVVVQKRHHARFFPMRREDADRSGNVLPGTVVDSGCTHPSEFDFYLASHPGLQGTSKPTHYHVLHDENNFTSDALQELTYRLCYLYCRATKAVSVCPPAYYAHLVAARARYHFQGDWSEADSDPEQQRMAASAALASATLEQGGEAVLSTPTTAGMTDSPDGMEYHSYGRPPSLPLMRVGGGQGSMMGIGGMVGVVNDEGSVTTPSTGGSMPSFGAVKPELQRVMYFM